MFNLKHPEGQANFQIITSNTDQLSNCFTNDEPFLSQSSKWMENLNSCVKQSFPKIRITNKSIKTKEHLLMVKRCNLRQQLKLAEDDVARDIFEREISEVENELAASVSKEKF